MKQGTIAKIALYLIVVLVFNVLYFNIFETHTPARWVSYAGIHLSYLLLCASSLSFDKFAPGGSVVHVYPKMMVANGYFLASLFWGLVLIVINNSTVTFPVIVHSIIIGFYLFHYLLLMNAETHTEANERRNRRDAFFVEDCAGRLDLAMRRAPSRDAWCTIERFKDAIRGASMRTVPEVAGLEERIRAQVVAVDAALESGDASALERISKDGVLLVRERERQIRLYK